MKSDFSTAWVSSVQPRKQRKYRYNAPLHIRHKFLSAHLSKELRKKYGKRSLPLRKGDEVLVMRGSFSKKKAKVISINTTRGVVALEGLQRSKKDGTKINVLFRASALMIHTLDAADKQRLNSEQGKAAKHETKAAEKTEKKAEKKEEKSHSDKAHSEKKGGKHASDKTVHKH